ncbi:conserved hypothetical protein [Talaromyces marneffei ATCC 18224]|uniref:Carrier domain-containing protein n=1 Tax=Talaromyces marneffei (strain ATCC 18224 / CBS 334.59 / QM 7333) TaxID=441960 RepID=B6QN85_TALMQ|nr:conserved hypothetical protein [Talaromyces marneffei ATCC 18224]
MASINLVDHVLEIIVSETGVSPDELYNDVYFADLGLDDILSKLIIDRIAEVTAVNLGPNVFQTCDTVGSLKQHLAQIASRTTSGKKNTMPKLISTRPQTNKDSDFRQEKPSSLAIRLQGDPQKAQHTIFLLPDGSGTGMAYARIPLLGPEICLYGLNSPFLSSLEGATAWFNCSLEYLAQLWIPAIRSVQHRGPYILGGWSAGGYYAFEVAKQLIYQGDMVSKLVLIDSPCRLIFEALPMEVVSYLSSRNLMGNWGGSNRGTPEWLIKHFDATIKSVGNYTPTPLESSAQTNMPEVYILWATDGVLTDGGVERSGLDMSVKVTRFLLDRPPDFGPLGWEELFPGMRLKIARIPGNHFTIVHDPYVSTVNLIRITPWFLRLYILIGGAKLVMRITKMNGNITTIDVKIDGN